MYVHVCIYMCVLICVYMHVCMYVCILYVFREERTPKLKKYGFSERIGDGIHLEVAQILLRLSTLGEFRTGVRGPW